MTDNQDFPAFQSLVEWVDHDKRIQRERMARVEAALSAGLIPVPDPVLHELCTLFITDSISVLRSHPGFRLNEKIRSLRTTLKLFERAVADVDRILKAFDEFMRTSAAFQPAAESQLEEFETTIRKELFAYCALGHSLKDHCTGIQSEMVVPSFSSLLSENFGEDGLHDFVCGLRNVLHHARFIEADWLVRQSAPDMTTHFMLSKEELIFMDDKWNKSARRYLDGAPENLDVGELCRDYAARVNAFYTAYLSKIEEQLPMPVSDYRRCWATKRGHDFLTAWKAVVGISLQQKIDPMEHLSKFLKPTQIEAIQVLRYRSREQVDLIIEMADKYKVCDDEMRQLVYRSFGITQCK